MRRIALFALLLLAPCFALADTTFLINFETTPVLPVGPSTFAAAGPAQIIVVPGVATITGGVVLGNETNLPAQSFATPPNVYGTAGFGDSLSSTLTITFDPAFSVDEVSFPILNGSTQAESYVVDAFNGATLIGTQTLSDVASNGSSGFGIIDLASTTNTFTSVTIAPLALDASCCSGWDYSIDSIALNESVQTAVGGPTPEPASIELLGLGMASLLEVYRRTRPLRRRS
jgi:hypothetical protein